MSFVAGPGVGGVLVQVLTAPFALVADVLSYLGSALLLTRIAPPENAGSRSEGGGLQIGSGLAFIVRSAVLRQLLLGLTVINLFNYVFHALLILYVTTIPVSEGKPGEPRTDAGLPWWLAHGRWCDVMAGQAAGPLARWMARCYPRSVYASGDCPGFG
jgi:hypothetical protein